MEDTRRNLNLSNSSNRCSHTGNTETNSSLAQMYCSSLRKYFKILEDKTESNDVSDSEISNKAVLDLYTNVLPDITTLTKKCEQLLAHFISAGGKDVNLINSVELAIASALSWNDTVKDLYRDRELHLNTSSKAMTDTITTFKSDGSVTVYEFLKSVEDLTQNDYSNIQKARFLYSRLEKKIQLDVCSFNESYSQMKDYLVKKFGKVKDIIKSKVSTIKNTKLGSNHADYYRSVLQTLTQIQTLDKTTQLPEDTLHDHIYKTEFVTDIISYLPKQIRSKFLNSLTEKDVSLSDVDGKEAFDLLLQLIKKAYTREEMSKEIPDREKSTTETKLKRSDKRKGGSVPLDQVNLIETDNRGRSDSFSSHLSDSSKSSRKATPKRKSVHAVDSSKNPGKGKSSPKKERKSKPWYDQKLKFPCPLAVHAEEQHEIGSCDDFFALSAKGKRSAGYQKLCWTCLGPRDKCRPKCLNYNKSKFPRKLTCQDCKQNLKNTNQSPLSVLMCIDSSHEKPKYDDLNAACGEWFPDFKKSTHKKDSLKQHSLLVAVTQACACGSDRLTCSCSTPVSNTREPSDEDEVPCFNTHTGETVEDVDESDVITETVEDSMFVMQMLNLAGEDCLTLYDSGSNQHLINGSLAEKLRLKVLCADNMSIGVVGSGRIWTNYGVYAMLLGPDTTGGMHEMICQGITNITDPFPKYSFGALNKELLRSGKIPSDTILPEYIGGMPTKLLIGIKSSTLQPQLEFSLPSGLGVFRSEIKDKFGSRLCYGGPSKFFTQVNRRCNGSFNFTRCFFMECISNYKESVFGNLRFLNYSKQLEDEDCGLVALMPEPVPFSIPMTEDDDSPILYPTALSEHDFNDLGCVDPDRSEDLIWRNISTKNPLDVCSVCLSSTAESPHSPCSSCFKAKIPLQKLKGMIDEDDVDNIVDYRCPSCAECKRCKESNRSKTLSLQERMEQDLIEKSVKLDTETNKVWIDLPFLKPPDEFLSKRHRGPSNYYQAEKVYKSQCRKSEDTKAGIRIVQQDLVDKGFMKKLTDLPSRQQEIVKNAPFQHYFPWRTVAKDSISTPVRMVVDPSSSGLNLILAKGQNTLNKIHSILIKARCDPFIWTADISKLYNCLNLNESSYPYSLFLFHTSMDPDIPPDVWVMLTAWYGVSSSAAQSNYALLLAALEKAETHPAALEVIRDRIYMDDTLSGDLTEALRDLQIKQTQDVLATGGFKLKYIVESGKLPPENAST